MLLEEVNESQENNVPLVWKDPDPIEGNNYKITKVFGLDKLKEFSDEELEDCPILIHYGECSEAEVFLSEIELA